jgi:holo-[acyl-carrier protein] synthase
MILGVGIDLVQNSRIERLLKKFDNHFIKKIFTEQEIAAAKKISSSKKLSQYYAKRFAAKEAFSKATGFGIGKKVSFLDVSVENEPSGKPKVIISPKLLDFLKNYFNKNEIKINVSLTDEKEFSQAIVILSYEK